MRPQNRDYEDALRRWEQHAAAFLDADIDESDGGG
jgi:hypothetical protein